jgi:hypothetical protein
MMPVGRYDDGMSNAHISVFLTGGDLAKAEVIDQREDSGSIGIRIGDFDLYILPDDQPKVTSDQIDHLNEVFADFMSLLYDRDRG